MINVQAKPEGLSVKVIFVCLGNVSSRWDKLVIVRSESVAAERESPPVMGAGLQDLALGWGGPLQSSTGGSTVFSGVPETQALGL